MTPPVVRLERVTDTEVAMSGTSPTLEECLPLARLYARFDEWQKGLESRVGSAIASHGALYAGA